MRHIHAKPLVPKSSSAPSRTLLQRQRASNSFEPSRIPPSVSETLQSSGQALDAQTRAQMEPRLGHDFSRVKIHTDARAAESAREVNALAYTVGRDIVFNTGQYAPHARAGQELIAHELAHVAQQARAGTTNASAISQPNDPFEREAKVSAQRALNGEPPSALTNAPAQISRQTPGEETPTPLPVNPPDAVPLKEGDAPAEAKVCDPDTALSWANFNVGTGSNSAFTKFDFNVVKIGDKDRVQAKFNATGSWVEGRFKTPNDRKLSGCAAQIAGCEDYFAKLKKGETGEVNLTFPQNCAASPTPDPSVLAKKKSDCASVLGPECDRIWVEDSARLLKHEQLHFDIACQMAKKGYALLDAGTVKDAQKVKTAINSAADKATKDYDDQTSHGCKAVEQATWVKDVGAGLTKYTVEVK